ncbi:hypothetical protein [Sebaldella sp. S0638]|uniref:hypothetical protein n=1 Tax=Sebaldella sp. S0638 TaxID=2957809 RepID=UPI0020A00024|nr:hypothetical protein [Sebaldella sp. S0638]MCP1226201.1 hypothetical protein [Sebaldella sp. S0638]
MLSKSEKMQIDNRIKSKVKQSVKTKASTKNTKSSSKAEIKKEHPQKIKDNYNKKMSIVYPFFA